MLSRINRLTADKDFDRLFKTGRGLGGRGLGIKMRPNGLAVPRLAFIVSTKVSKNAVDRNRLKRRMREIIRGLLPKLPPGLDIAVIARPDALKLDFAALRTSIGDLLRRARLI